MVTTEERLSEQLEVRLKGLATKRDIADVLGLMKEAQFQADVTELKADVKRIDANVERIDANVERILKELS